MAVIIGNFTAKQIDPVLRSFQTLGGSNNSNKIPHKLADLAPALRNDNFFVAVGYSAFIPRNDRRCRQQAVPISLDMRGARVAEDETFEQRIRRQPVRAVQARLRYLARSI